MKRTILAKSVHVALAMSLAISHTSIAQEHTETASEDVVERIAVTGSHLKRSNLEGISPITIISSEAILEQGFNTVYDALNSLSSNAGFTIPESNSGSWSAGTQTVNLRGMGSNRSLVLLNYQRLPVAPKAYDGTDNVVDLGMIPAAAIDRIEIVSTGASAIYGSDAMAGVINIILKKDYDGAEINVLGGQSDHGDLENLSINAVKGWNGGSWNITAGLSYEDRNGITGNDRKDFDGIEDIPNPSTWSSYSLYSNDTEIWSWYHGQILPSEEDCAATDNQVVEPNGRYCGHERIGETSIVQPREVMSAFLTANFDVTDNIVGKASVFYNQTRRRNTSYWSATPQDVEVWDIAYDDQGNPDWNNSVWMNDLWFVKRISPQNHNPDITYKNEMYTVQLGLTGDINDTWTWDLNATAARNESLERYPVLTQENWARLYLGFGNAGTPLEDVSASSRWVQYSNYEVFRMDVSEMNDLYLPLYGAVGIYEDPGQRAESYFVNADTKGRSDIANISLITSGELGELPGGPIGIAIVTEYSTSKISLRNTPDEFAKGLVNWYVGLAAEGKRDHAGIGVEAYFPITDTFSVTAATRYDDYNDDSSTGGAQTYMLGLEYRPTDSLLLRSSYSTNFRAPDMHRLFAAKGTEFNGGITDSLIAYNSESNADVREESAADWDFSCEGCTWDRSFEVGTGGDLTLKEETGYTANIGAVYDVFETLSITVDMYEIKIKDRIITNSMQDFIDLDTGCQIGHDIYNPSIELDSSSGRCIAAAKHVVRDEDGVLLPVLSSNGSFNQGMLKSRGLDLSVNYQIPNTKLGDFNAFVAYSYIDSYKTQYADGEEIIEWIDNDSGLVRHKGTVSVGWAYDDVNVQLTSFYTGPSLRYDGDGLGNSMILTNLFTGYQVNDALFANISVSNLFDEGMPSDSSWNAYPFGNAQLYGFAMRGREYRIGLNYKF